MGKLSDLKIQSFIKDGTHKTISDGDGLTLTLSATGTTAWVLRYRVPGSKSQKEMTIGRYPDISLSEARKRASQARAKIQSGVDVAREKKLEKQSASNAWTFRRLAEDYLEKATGRLADSTIDGRKQQLRDYA